MKVETNSGIKVESLIGHDLVYITDQEGNTIKLNTEQYYEMHRAIGVLEIFNNDKKIGDKCVGQGDTDGD